MFWVDLLGVVFTLITTALLLIAVKVLVQEVWRGQHGRPLDVLFIVAAPLLSGLIFLAVGSRRPWAHTLIVALALGQPYFLLRIAWRFREVPRIVDWIVTLGTVLVLIGFISRPALTATAWGTWACACSLYVVFAFWRQSRSSAGVTRMRLLYGATAGLLSAMYFFTEAINAYGEYVYFVRAYAHFGVLFCYFFAFSPPRRLAARWQRAEQARFLTETSARDPEARGRHSAVDLVRATQRSVANSGVVVALRASPKSAALVVESTTAAALSGRTLSAVEASLVARVAATGIGASGTPAECSPEVASVFTARDARVLVAPVCTAAQQWGVVVVGQAGGRTSLFPEDDLRLLEQFGFHTATGLDHAYLFTQARERERERAARLVHAVESKMSLTLDSIKDHAMFVLDAAGRVATWHVGAQNVFGYAGPEITGRSASQLFDMTSVDFTAWLDGALGTGSATREGRCRRLDGHEFIGATTIRLLDAEGDGPPGLVAVTKDVTEQRELEARLRQSHKMEALGQLAGGVAHDFNNLLQAIRGNADFLEQALDGDEARMSEVHEVQRAADRATSLTRQLLSFTRRKLLDLDPAPVNLAGLVNGMLPMLRRLIGEHVEMVDQCVGDGATVVGDRGQLEQVLMNLALNAADAMPGGGRLVLRTSVVWVDDALSGGDVTPGSYVLLEVIDTGSGMDAETVARIFEPFFTTKELHDGTGLGLATVYGIVRQMAGTIRVESRKGHGSTFRLYFPQTRQSEVEARLVPVEAALGGTETLLLVEDDENVRPLVVGMLQRGGYRVLSAGHPTEALEILRSTTDDVHLVITDVVLPGGTGIELVQKLTAIRPGLPALYMSGYADGVLGQQGTFPKASHFLQKPFNAPDLLRRVRQILSLT